MNSNNKKAIILLSGGLDSLVSLAKAKDDGLSVELALIFNYGQKAFANELTAVRKISEFYNVPFKVIELDWLKDITSSSIVSDSEIPYVDTDSLDDKEVTISSMKNVWVPNRNGLFVNIAASFCDSFGYDYIILGANKEEAQTFSDNSLEFVQRINHAFEYSTNHDIKLYVPLISLDKLQIVDMAIDLNAPLEFVNSCYDNTKKHCGRCESCNRLKRALVETGNKVLLEKIFG